MKTIEQIALQVAEAPGNQEGIAPPPAIPDWISVEDRLPEEHQEVMCAFGNGDMLILEFDISLAPYRFIDRDSGKWWSLKIKHWMPLPNPPAQGEQE